MDISPRMRAVQRLTNECLRLVRMNATLPTDESEALLKDFAANMHNWIDAIVDPPAHLAVRELPDHSGYSLWASSYDHEPDNRVIEGEERLIWSVIGACTGKRVLDVGCGTGRHTNRLAEEGAEVVASEPNETLLAIAKSKQSSASSRVQWLPFDIAELPDGLGLFDTVLCCLVLSHVEDIDSALRKLSRYVSENGAIIVTDFHPFNMLIGWRTAFTHDGKKYVVPNYLHLPSEYFQALRGAGFEVEGFWETGDFPQLPQQPATLIFKGRKLPDGC